MNTFYNYGIPATREIISVSRNSAGEYDWTPHVAQYMFLANNPSAPWNRENAISIDPADYPGMLWTPPMIVELVNTPLPDPIPGKIFEPVLVWTETSCTRDWQMRDMTSDELANSLRKIWKNSQAFLAEFSLSEIAQISISTSPTIAALRFILSTWSGEIFSDDERVVTGLDAIQSTEIINAIRRIEILKK